MISEKRLNKSEIFQIFHTIENDFSMMVQENMVVFNPFLSHKVIKTLEQISTAVFKEIERSKEFYNILDTNETVTTESFVKFLNALYDDIHKTIKKFDELVIVEDYQGEQITTHVFFMIFIRLIIVMQVSILIGEVAEEKLDNILLEVEYERMKREGLL